MKYCANCGTKMSDENLVCPQCGYSSMDSQTKNSEQIIPSTTPTNVKQQSKKNKQVKWYILIPIVIIISILTSVIVSMSVTNHIINTNSINNDYDLQLLSTDCPEDEYGHHSWGSATCEHPAVCLNCGVYKDNELGYHAFELDEETGLVECWHCHMLKDDYDSKE